MPAIDVPPEYGFVLIVAGVLVLEGFYLGSSVMRVRKKIFGDEFVKKGGQHQTRWLTPLAVLAACMTGIGVAWHVIYQASKLLDEHKKAFPNARFTLGYPDMGSGRFSDLLSYEDWYKFNLAQRGHYNMLESVWGVYGMLLVGGLFKPVEYAALGATYALSRILYAVGYSSPYGPKGRELGAVTGILSTLGMVGLTIFQGWTLVQPLLKK